MRREFFKEEGDDYEEEEEYGRGGQERDIVKEHEQSDNDFFLLPPFCFPQTQTISQKTKNSTHQTQETQTYRWSREIRYRDKDRWLLISVLM